MPTAAELLAALPAESEEGSVAAQEVESVLRALSDRPVPPGALQRFCSLGGLSAKLGLAYMAWWTRSWYQPTEKSEQDLLETNLRCALNTLETASYLRGAVSKVGQIMSCLPQMVPEEFADALTKLQFNAPPMHYALVREQLLSELGDPEDIFAEFNETAIAAASIGQVHEARLKTGEKVAVKIQYPGIGRSIRSDLRNLKTFMRPFLFNDNWKAFLDLFDELRAQLELEADYEHEAQNIRDVRKLFVEDEFVVVPRVFEDFSTRRVLTMEFIEGKMLEEYVATNPSQEDLDHYGKQISRAQYRTYRHNLIYTDPHPGNFIFMDERRLGFIDFGNIRRCNEEEWEFVKMANETRYTKDPEVLRSMCQKSLMMTDEEARQRPEVLDLVLEMLHHYNEALLFEGEFDYSDPSYLKRGAELLHRSSKMNWVRQRKQNVFTHRLQFLLPALLLKLKSRVNVPELVREETNCWELTSRSQGWGERLAG